MSRILIALVLLAAGSRAWAQVPGSDVRFTDSQLEDILERSLDAQIVITAGPGVGSGYYSFDDTDVEVTRLSMTVRLPPRSAPEPPPEPTGDGFFDRIDMTPYVRVRLRAAAGFTEMVDPVDFLADYGAEGEVVTQVQSYRGGLGIDFNLGDFARLTPLVYVAWTKATGVADGDVLGRTILGLYYDEVLVNWRMEAITLMPGVQAAVSLPAGPLSLDLTGSATYLHSRTLSATSELQEIKTDSFVSRQSLAIDIPLGFSLFDYPIHIRPGFGYIFIIGDARQALGAHHFVNPFVELIARTDTLIEAVVGDGWPRMTELGVAANFIYGKRARGWNVGVAVSFEF